VAVVRSRTLATLHGTRIRTLLSASTSPSVPQPLPSSLLPSDLTPHLNDPNVHATFDSISKEVQLFPPVFPGMEPLKYSSNSLASSTTTSNPVAMEGVSSLDTDQAGISIKPDSDHLWSLPSSESHMLWDLFHDHRPSPVTNTTNQPLNLTEGGGSDSLSVIGGNSNPLSPSQLLVNSRPSTAGGGDSGDGTSGDSSSSNGTTGSSSGGKGKKKKRDRSDGAEGEQTSSTSTATGEDWVHRNALETDWLNSEPGAWAW